MPRFKPWQSVVTRLIACLVLGGVAMSAGLSVLEYQRSAADLRMQLSQRIALTAHNLQNVLKGLLDEPRAEELRDVLGAFTADHPVDAVRLAGPDIDPIALGAWPGASFVAIDSSGAAHAPDTTETYQWSLAERPVSAGDEIAMDRPTRVHVPFTHGGRRYQLDLRVDGPAARAQMRQQIVQRMATQWLILAVMLLLALLLVRRWFTGPLSDVVELIDRRSGPEPYRRLGRRHASEFGRLADAMAEMLGRIASTSAELTRRERAFHDLYEFAPTAMVSLDPEGRIVQANRRAATLLRADAADALIGQEAVALVSEHDRPRLLETIERLDVDETTQCELQLAVGEPPRHAALEAAAVRDEDGTLTAVRLSLLDVTDWRRLRRQLEDQKRLLHLVIDHMSDAILLVDEHQRVAAFNRRLTDLLQRQPDTLTGAPYDREQFWEPLGPLDKAQFLERVARIEAEPRRTVQERFETHKGVFQFQSMVLHDASQAVVGRLWVVHETTPQEQHQRLLHQQHRQLGALKQVSTSLGQASSVDAVLARASEHLHQLLGVEAVGVILRNRDAHRRCRQIIHRGSETLLREPNRELAQSFERHLVPLVLHSDDVAFWPDPPHDTDWGRAIEQAGLTCLAAGPLRGPHETLGIVWIARRGGERLERHHLHMLETLIPTIAARLHIVELEQRLETFALTDHDTALPGRPLFDQALQQMGATHEQLAVLVLELDRRGPEPNRHQPVTDTATLQSIVHRLQSVCRRSTFVARLGAGRLGLIVPAVTAASARQLAERLQATLVDDPVRLADGQPIVVAVSIGVACRGDGTADVFSLHELAANRAELARRGGRTIVLEGDHGQGAQRVG